ncbi:hypothetical protein [Kibdelosporangium aridum]|uniref:Uncharacterized protein n=1 Tax=Kibdelosporangium aridum TaxID=2030 RepID=A0A1W2DI24_KIBAR|nr:hypothetical protein [Kibdelosporangium aridum]SMC96712.1 hypothetical protein SAMN05661093_03345 [Kibdelosporangium aridum]
MHRVVVVVGGFGGVVVVVVVVFVTSLVVVTVFGGVVVVFELDSDADDEPDDEEEELDSELTEVSSETCVALAVGGADEVVPFVATCSSRTGTGLSVRPLVTPTANKAAAAAPRNAPTAIRNGAPLLSSTRYTYRVNPIGSSEVD